MAGVGEVVRDIAVNALKLAQDAQGVAAETRVVGKGLPAEAEAAALALKAAKAEGQAGGHWLQTAARNAGAARGARYDAVTTEQLSARAASAVSSSNVKAVTQELPSLWANQEVGALALKLGLRPDQARTLTGLAEKAGARSAQAYEGFVRDPATAFTKNADGSFTASQAYGAAHNVASAEAVQLTKTLQNMGLPSLDSSIAKINAMPKAEQLKFMTALTDKMKNPAGAIFTNEERSLALAIGFARTTWASSQGPRALVGRFLGNAGEAIRADPSQRPAYNFTAELVKKFGDNAPAEIFKDLEQLGARWSAS